MYCFANILILHFNWIFWIDQNRFIIWDAIHLLLKGSLSTFSPFLYILLYLHI